MRREGRNAWKKRSITALAIFSLGLAGGEATDLLNVLVLIDAGRQCGGEALVDVGLAGQLPKRLHALLGEELLLVLVVQAVQAPLIRLAEVDDVDVGLVDGLHLALPGVHAHRGGPVDACGGGEESNIALEMGN